MSKKFCIYCLHCRWNDTLNEGMKFWCLKKSCYLEYVGITECKDFE